MKMMSSSLKHMDSQSMNADNTDGYNVDLDFEEKDCAIRVTIQSPE